MNKLQKKPTSMREETFALAGCACACPCACHESCSCPIAPTHQYGINAQNDWVSKSGSTSGDTSATFTRAYRLVH